MATYDDDEFSQECRSGIDGFAGFVGVPHKGYIREDIGPYRPQKLVKERVSLGCAMGCLLGATMHPASRECGRSGTSVPSACCGMDDG